MPPTVHGPPVELSVAAVCPAVMALTSAFTTATPELPSVALA